MTFTFFPRTASINIVLPDVSLMFGFAPLSRSIFAMSYFPASAASASGDFPETF